MTRLLADERGATAVEYGLIVACIFLAIIGGLSLFATNANTMYTSIANTVGGAVR
jgi:pilus assembly protein Flp/PilA